MTHTEYKNLRESIGTQEIVASLLGIARETIARRETGRATIGTEATFALQFLAGGAPDESIPSNSQDPRDSEIDDIRKAIADIENNPSCYNGGGQGISFDEHRAQFMPAYLAYLESCALEARQVLPADFARFEAEFPGITGADRLLRFQDFFGDQDVAGFERWDKDFNAGNTWKNPRMLTDSARLSLDILRKRLNRLERSQA